MWSNKYIGIPFKSRGRDYSGIDCWGLVRLVYSEQYNINLPSFEQDYTDSDTIRINELISQYKEGWQSVDSPEAGNIVLLNIFGQPRHVGVMVNSTDFLHSRNGYDVAIDSIIGTRWSNRIAGFYKYTDKTKYSLQELPVSLQAKLVPLTIEQPVTLDIVANKLLNLVDINSEEIILLLNNNIVQKENWSNITVNHSDIISYRLVPESSDARTIFTLAAIIVIAMYAPNYLMTTYGLTAGQAAGATVALTTATTYAINAIFPIEQPEQRDPGSTEQQYMVGGGNRANLYSTVPLVLGKTKFTPPLLGQSYINYPEERTSYLTVPVTWGWGPVTFSTIKVGEANLSDYTLDSYQGVANSAYVNLNGYNDSVENIAKFNALYANDIEQPSWNATTLTCSGTPGFQTAQAEGDYDWEAGTYTYTVTATSTPIASPGNYFNPPGSTSSKISEVAIAFHMPQGMRRIITKGSAGGTSESILVRIQTQYKYLQDGSNGTIESLPWQDWETFDIEGNKKDAYTIVRKKLFTNPGKVIVQARRLTGADEEAIDGYRYNHQVVLLNVTYTSNISPINIPAGCSLARGVYVIKATDQLNGQLEGINSIVQSICKPIVKNSENNYGYGSTYTTASSNPAELFLHVLTHPTNPQKIDINDIANQVNLVQLGKWWEYCAESRSITFNDALSSTSITKTYKYEYNGIIAEQKSVLEVLRQICAAGRASPALIDGKWTVTIDEPKTTIVQHFSPHNSWGFEGIRNLPKEPDGLKIIYYDEEQNYQEVETIIYNTGKNYTNSTLFESISLTGVTNRGAVVDHAKWHFAQLKLRREVYSLNCDIEYLACNRGDRVKVTHDVPAWGVGSGRINYKYVDTSGKVSVVKLTESLLLDSTKTYNIRIRSKNGTSTNFTVPTQISFTGFSRNNNTITITLDPATIATIPFDETEKISINCASFTGINIQNQTVSINRTNNTISYTVSGIPGNSGFNTANGSIILNGYYKYVLLSGAVDQGNLNIIDVDNLFLFGEINKESQDLIVISIEPQDNKTARLTLVDYGDFSQSGGYNIFTDYKTLTSSTVFNTNITSINQNLIDVFSTDQIPYISRIYSNDDATEITAPGSYTYNIKVSYATVQDIPKNTKYIQLEYGLLNASNTSTQYNQNNTKIIVSENLTDTITISDVIVGQTYKIRLRYLTDDGVASLWTSYQTHTVVGNTKNYEVINNNEITTKRVGKLLRITISSAIPSNFKSFIVKVYKNNTNINQDFWTTSDANNIKTIKSTSNIIDFNILDFPSPRISEAGTTYRVACRFIDIAGNESISSGISNITLSTILP